MFGKSIFFCLLFIQFLLPLATYAATAPLVSVQGLFPSKAVLKINGELRVLRVGQTSPEGVTLVFADSEEAVIEVSGKKRTYVLGRDYGAFEAKKDSSVSIKKDLQGMYRMPGSINGKQVAFLVDTGASDIALSQVRAKALNLNYKEGKLSKVMTASDVVDSYLIKLNSVKIGEIELKNVSARVILTDYPTDVLLGMSFLKRVEMSDTGQVLTLKKKW